MNVQPPESHKSGRSRWERERELWWKHWGGGGCAVTGLGGLACLANTASDVERGAVFHHLPNNAQWNIATTSRRRRSAGRWWKSFRCQSINRVGMRPWKRADTWEGDADISVESTHAEPPHPPTPSSLGKHVISTTNMSNHARQGEMKVATVSWSKMPSIAGDASDTVS